MNKIENKYVKTNNILDVSTPLGRVISTNQMVKEVVRNQWKGTTGRFVTLI